MRAFTKPLWLSGLGKHDDVCRLLEPVPLRLRSDPGPEREGQGLGDAYDEAWLQELLHRHPSLLPIESIEPAYWPATAICRELPVPSGFVDNLLLTPDGGIIVVEAKLWRNPQARREVVGQILDYAKDLSSLDYEALQARVRLALKEPAADLFQLASRGAEPSEEMAFIDAVERNLRLGRFLTIICGDGIQEGAEQLTEFLQRHIGLHFTLALVEMSLWREPGGRGVLVQPRILARTLQIERAVVRVESGITLRPAEIQPSPAAARSSTISEDAFFEGLQEAEPGLPTRLRAFLVKVEPLNIFADVKRNLSLKWRAPDGRALNLGSIFQNGEMGTDYAQWSGESVGRLSLATAYQNALARLLPEAEVKRTPKETGWRVVINGADPKLTLFLDHEDEWIAAITEFTSGLGEAIEAA